MFIRENQAITRRNKSPSINLLKTFLSFLGILGILNIYISIQNLQYLGIRLSEIFYDGLGYITDWIPLAVVISFTIGWLTIGILEKFAKQRLFKPLVIVGIIFLVEFSAGLFLLSFDFKTSNLQAVREILNNCLNFLYSAALLRVSVIYPESIQNLFQKRISQN